MLMVIPQKIWCFVLFWTVQLSVPDCSVACISAKHFSTIKTACLNRKIHTSHVATKNFSYNCTCRRLQLGTSNPESCAIAVHGFLAAEVSWTGHGRTLRSCCQPSTGPLCPHKQFSCSFQEKPGGRDRNTHWDDTHAVLTFSSRSIHAPGAEKIPWPTVVM